jgi:hypothetical protein
VCAQRYLPPDSLYSDAVESLNCSLVKLSYTMGTNSSTNLTDLTENMKAILKVLADADGEVLRGVEVRRRLREDYDIELSKEAMNGVIARRTRYPRHMVNIEWVDDSEIDGNTRHASHQLKPDYIDKVREQLQ